MNEIKLVISQSREELKWELVKYRKGNSKNFPTSDDDEIILFIHESAPQYATEELSKELMDKLGKSSANIRR